VGGRRYRPGVVAGDELDHLLHAIQLGPGERLDAVTDVTLSAFD
jgi:hypothetical protein